MKKEIGKFLVPAGRFAATCAFSLALILALPALAQADGPAQEVFLPKSQKGPVVVLISGQSGTSNYRFYGRDVAALGYYTVLIDGKDILTRQQDGAQNLRKVIARAQTAPEATPGKVAVVGFSQGGSGVLLHAVTMPELISAAIAYYPGTDWTKNLDALAARIQIPLLVLAGERDRYKNCCVIESIRTARKTLEEGRKTLGAAKQILSADAPLQQDLRETLRELARTAQSLRVLTDYLERHPESLIRGKQEDKP